MQQPKTPSLRFTNGIQHVARRPSFAVRGTKGQPDGPSCTAPIALGDADPATRDLEGMRFVHGASEPVRPTFDRYRAASRRRKLRVQALTMWVGPNGANANLKNPEKAAPK